MSIKSNLADQDTRGLAICTLGSVIVAFLGAATAMLTIVLATRELDYAAWMQLATVLVFVGSGASVLFSIRLSRKVIHRKDPTA